jgi:hypothetical protein
MIEDFVTDLPDGALPSFGNGEVAVPSQVCDEVTLHITICYVNKETGYIVARFALDSPYWIDSHDAANGTWSLALPRYEMMKLLCTYLQSKFMKVILRREELLTCT